MHEFDAPESPEDARLQELLREALAGDGPDVTSAVLGSSPARRHAAFERAAGSQASRSARVLQAALMVLAAGAVVALAVMRWRDVRVQADQQDPLLAERVIVEVASREQLPQILGQVESASLQIARPVPEMPWRITMTRLAGVVGVLGDEQCAEVARSVGMAEQTTARMVPWEQRAYLDLQLNGHQRVVIPVHVMAKTLTLDLGGAGLVSLPRATAGLGGLYERLNQRADALWALVTDPVELAATPNTLEELCCHGLDARAIAKALRRMPALRRLHLWKVHADADLVQQIAGCPMLEALTLASPPPATPFAVAEDAVFDAHSLAPFKSLRNLHRLHVEHRPVDPADIALLTAIRDLSLDHCPLRAPGLSLIAALPLTRCALSHSMGEQEDLERALAGFARVERLHLSFDERSSPAAVRGVAGLRQLRELRIASQPYWDRETLNAIAALPDQMPWAKVTSANQ